MSHHGLTRPLGFWLARYGGRVLYTAKAESLLLVIADGPPAARETWICGEHDVLASGWGGKTVIDPAVADACQPDGWLLVVAWDES